MPGASICELGWYSDHDKCRMDLNMKVQEVIAMPDQLLGIASAAIFATARQVLISTFAGMIFRIN